MVGRLGVLAFVMGITAVAHGQVPPGTMIDKSSADRVKDMLPPEIYKHYQAGDYKNPVVEFPNSKFRWDDGFDEATKKNGQTIVLDENKQPVDKTTGKRPDYLTGIPFPDIQESDPDGGYKIIWNLYYAYYNGGNSHNETSSF